MFGFGGASFTPASDIPDLSSKVIIVTGGNIGLGYESIVQLAKHNPGHIYLAARNKEKADAAIEKVKKETPNANISHLALDLTSFDSIKKAADEFKASNNRLDILMNNAGIMACPAGTTTEGYEIQFGTNHVGHALFTKLLLPTLKKTAAEGTDVHVVNLSSEGHRFAPKGGILLADAKSKMEGCNTWTRYGHSKLANILFARELARHNPELKVTAIHPGGVNTNLVEGPYASYPFLRTIGKILVPMITVPVSKGALNQIWASVSKDVKPGQYYTPVAKASAGSSYAQDGKLAEDLWAWTEKELASHGY